MAERLDIQEQLIRQMHQRMDAILAEQQHRFVDIAMGLGGVNPLENDPVEGFYAGGDGMQDNRAEEGHTATLEQLHERMQALQQAREQEQQRSHEQGMG